MKSLKIDKVFDFTEADVKHMKELSSPVFLSLKSKSLI